MGAATLSSSPGPAGWSRSVPLLAGDEGTAQTVALIRQAVHDGLRDPLVRAQLAAILRGVPPYDSAAEARAIYEWVRRNIRFTNDPVGHETVSTAAWTLTHGIGDCDDINAVLLPTLVMMAGIPVRLVTVSNDPSDPSRFSHIYAEAEFNGQWVPLDAARPGARFGSTVSRYVRKRVWSLLDSSYRDISRGLAGVAVAQGMGTWVDDLTSIITSGAKGASDIIASISHPDYRVFSVPPGAPGAPTAPGPVTTPSISTNTLLLGLGAAALFLMSKK